MEFDFEHKRQSGGRGQYGRAWGCARPLEDVTAENFNDLVTGTDLPRNFIKPLIQGMKNSMAKGPQIGAPVAGIEVDIVNGKHHQYVFNIISNTILYRLYKKLILKSLGSIHQKSHFWSLVRDVWIKS